ncbi:hypothetical protein NW762_008857 [Fusarium torreyae]|uniref:Uncharacterized protein n=1 Tax=Fusarium torreyae TaxID=1237075 RepID=A0A9W8RW45_9HYPO|nr:hypothetical protein NW762_008857 [Fusarium torreyae]
MNPTQMTTEPSEPSSDESSDEETNRREIKLDGIQRSLNELDRFAIHIRQASTSPLDARVKAFGAKRPEQVSSFEIRATFTVNSLYPDAHEELRKHLSSLMTHKYTKILYWQSHDKKLRSDRRLRKKREDPISRAVHDSAHQRSKEYQAQEVSKPQVYEKSMSGTHASELRSQLTAPPANIHMEITMPTPRRAGASTVIGGGAKFPDPPVFEEGEHLKPCPLCRKIFPRTDYEDSLWWK